MKKILLLLLIFTVSCKAQQLSDLKLVKLKCKKYLAKKVNYKGEVSVYTLHNRINIDSLKNGIYGFSRVVNHSKTYFLIYEDGNVKILDVRTLKMLKKSISIYLDFAKKQGYCEEITNDYLNRFVRVYFLNAKRMYMPDLINCNPNINKKDLP